MSKGKELLVSLVSALCASVCDDSVSAREEREALLSYIEKLEKVVQAADDLWATNSPRSPERWRLHEALKELDALKRDALTSLEEEQPK